MKALMYMFLVFALLNIPLFMFYVNGQGPEAAKNPQPARFQDVFGRLSIGNLGVSDYTCGFVNVANNQTEIMLNCPYGTMRELTQYGLQGVDNLTCSNLMGHFIGENSTQLISTDCSRDG